MQIVLPGNMPMTQDVEAAVSVKTEIHVTP